MGRTRNAHKKRLLERQKTTESEFYRRGHEGLRPLKRVVCYKDADETTDDSDGDYSPETTRKRARTQTQTQTRTRREKLVTITRMMTRGWRRPTLLQLTYYDCPSSRMRAIKVWGSEIPAPDRRQATQRRVFEGKFINGKRVIGTYADKKSMTLHTLPTVNKRLQWRTAVRCNGTRRGRAREHRVPPGHKPASHEFSRGT
jgi:hypothetical protein